MRLKNVQVSLLLLIIAVLISACGAGAAPAESAMAEKPAPAGEAVEEKAAMADKGDDGAMMEEEAAGEAAMAEETPAEEAMAGKEAADEAAMAEEEMANEEAAGEAVMAEEAPAEEAMAGEEAAGEAMGENEAGAMATPAWFNAELTDVNTGEMFSIADLKGKVVLVETMAVWCPLCTRQQEQIRLLHDLLGEQADLISLSLDIDPNEEAEFLEAHATGNGFDWRYAVAPAEVSREIGQLYGAQFLNPPSTPMLIIDRQGEVHLLPFGQKDAQTLQEALSPLLNEG